MSNPIFHLGLLRNYQLVNKPGVYIVSVAYTVTEKHLILDNHPRFIVPLRAATAEGLKSLLSVVDEGQSIPFSLVSKHFLKGALWYSKVLEEDLPVKGERVLVTFDENEDGIILCTNIELLPREDLDYIDLNNLVEFRKTLFNLLQEETNS